MGVKALNYTINSRRDSEGLRVITVIDLTILVLLQSDSQSLGGNSS